MKTLKSLLVVGMIVLMLTGCGSQTVKPQFNPQAEGSSEVSKQAVDYDWWVGKQYKSESGDTFQAVYHKSNNVLAFCSVKTGVNLVTDYDRLPEIDTDDGKQILRYSDEIRKGDKLINATYVVYYPEIDTVTIMDLQGNICDTYKFYQTVDSTEPNDTVEDTTDVLRYECNDTPAGYVTLTITGLNSSVDWVDLNFACETWGNDYTLAIPKDELKSIDYMKYTYNTVSGAEDEICLDIDGSQLNWNASGDFEVLNGSYIQLPDVEE